MRQTPFAIEEGGGISWLLYPDLALEAGLFHRWQGIQGTDPSSWAIIWEIGFHPFFNARTKYIAPANTGGYLLDGRLQWALPFEGRYPGGLDLRLQGLVLPDRADSSWWQVVVQ